MPYRIQTRETLTKAFRRIAVEQLDRALTELNSRGRNSVKSLHSVRLRFKKIRALLRLIRTSIGSSFRTLNEDFREAGHALAAARESDVLKRTADRVRDAAAESDRADLGAVLSSAIRAGRKTRVDSRKKSTREDIRRHLKGCRGRLLQLSVARDDSILDGLKSTYRAGRDAWRTVRHASGDEPLHDLRKRCKDLGYQLRLIRDEGQRMLDAQIALLRDVADRLGDDHDLALLTAAIKDTPEFGQKDQRCGRALKQIADARAELQVDARRLAGIIYAEKPKAFAARMGSYRNAARVKR
jgi:CHAD domain-containing protein